MATKTTELVEYYGISERLPQNPSTFSQFMLTNELCLPTQKLDIERIVRVDTEISIEHYQIIKTPVATSLEGQIMTGNKLLVMGFLKQIIMYVSETVEQSVHSAHFYVPFCKYIVMPQSFALTTPITVIPYIEDVHVDKKDSRCVISCVTMLLDTKFCLSSAAEQNNCVGTAVKIVGVAETLPANPVYFKELSLQEFLIIPEQKPDIERILSVMTDVKVVSTRVVNTTSAVSLEGQRLSGCKLIVELSLNELILYVADRITQPVHSAHFASEMKSAFVVVPCELDGRDIYDLLQEGKLKITPYIEGVGVIKQNSRQIFKCITLLLDVTTRCSS